MDLLTLRRWERTKAFSRVAQPQTMIYLATENNLFIREYQITVFLFMLIRDIEFQQLHSREECDEEHLFTSP